MTFPKLMFAVGCAMLTGILLRKCYKRLGRRPRGKKDKAMVEVPRPDAAWSGAHRDTAAILQRQEVELYELSRDVTGQINSKMVCLQELIAQSQQQIDRMEELLEEVALAVGPRDD